MPRSIVSRLSDVSRLSHRASRSIAAAKTRTVQASLIVLLAAAASACGGGVSGPLEKAYVDIQVPASAASLSCVPDVANPCRCQVAVNGAILTAVDFSQQSIHVMSQGLKLPGDLWYVHTSPADAMGSTWSQSLDDLGGQTTICNGDGFVLFAAVLDQPNTPYIGMNPAPLTAFPLQILQFVKTTVVRP